MNYGIFLQIIAGIIAASAVWMVGRKKSYSKWGYIIGIISGFTWALMYVYYKQWFIMPVLLIHEYAWISGAYNHWVKK